MQKIQFDYFTGMEAEQYSFYRVPKVLFTEPCFKTLSCEAKVLYGLMLDRMSLSIKNRWFDEEDRVYIIFTVEEIAELTGLVHRKLKTFERRKGLSFSNRLKFFAFVTNISRFSGRKSGGVAYLQGKKRKRSLERCNF